MEKVEIEIQNRSNFVKSKFECAIRTSEEINLINYAVNSIINQIIALRDENSKIKIDIKVKIDSNLQKYSLISTDDRKLTKIKNLFLLNPILIDFEIKEVTKQCQKIKL
ncbi:MAG: hypothetical protein RR294_06205 [Bacilli bacterium]